MSKELSVVVPIYNEERLLAATLRETASYLRDRQYRFELLAVDDGSRDRSADIVRRLAEEFPEIRLIRLEKNRGKGEALKRGFAEARYAISLFMDADNSTSIKEWPAFEAAFEAGSQAVVGSRRRAGARIEVPQPAVRRFLGTGYRLLCRGLFGIPATDLNCGFKAYRTPLAKKLFGEMGSRDWVFDVELFCLLKKYGVAFSEVPVAWRHEQKHPLPTFEALRAAAVTLKSILRLYGKMKNP